MWFGGLHGVTCRSTIEAPLRGCAGNARDGRGAKAHDGDVPEDDWKQRAMPGPDKPWVLCASYWKAM